MATITDTKILLGELKKQIYHPIYLLTGNEPYYIDNIAGYMLEKILPEDEKGFNQHILYGKDTNVYDLIEQALSYPMMGNYQLIVVKEAQEMRDFDMLGKYAESPLSSTILVLCYKHKALDKRKKHTKSLIDKSCFFEGKKIKEYQVGKWITSYVKSKKYNIDAKSTQLLADSVGADLTRLTSELDKLFSGMGENRTITGDIIEKNIGISKEFNNFELQNALAVKNRPKAYQIVGYMGKHQKEMPIQQTIALLNRFFANLIAFHYIGRGVNDSEKARLLQVAPFALKEYAQAARVYPPQKVMKILAHIKQVDLSSKGIGAVNTPPDDMLKELIFKILN